MITQTFHSMKRNFFIRNVCLYILPLLIPLFLISVLAIVIINTYVKNEIDTRNINNLETNASTINALIDELERINITLSVNPSIKVRLKNVILKMEENNGIAAEDYQLVTAILDMLYSSVDYNPYIASVYIYFDNETEWFISNTNEFSNSDFFYDTDWLEKYKSKKGDTDRFWFEFRTIDNYLFQYGVSVKVLTIYNQIYSSGKSKPDGVLVLNVFEDELDTALGNLLEAPDESLYVVDNNGSIIFSNGKEGNLSSDELSLLDFGTSSSITYNGHCIYRVHSDSYNWMYYYTIPISSAYYMPRILTRAILIICMLSGLAGLILAYSFAYKSYKEIMELVEVIQQARNGKVSYSYEDDYISSVLDNKDSYSTFCSSMDDIHELMEDSTVFNSYSDILCKMLFIQIIVCLETYLSDTLINEIQENEEMLDRFILKFKEYNEKKISFSDIKAAYENRRKTAVTDLLNIQYHNIAKVRAIYQCVYDSEDLGFDNTDIYKLIGIRHELVHRNGKDKQGNPINLHKFDVDEAYHVVHSFVDNIRSKLLLLKCSNL